MPLLKQVFQWGREINPSQPLSVGVWNWELSELTNFQIKNSDVITYHNYGDAEEHRNFIASVKELTNKPLLCTESMARTRNSKFENILPILKENKIAAYSWGLADGKINTKYAWGYFNY